MKRELKGRQKRLGESRGPCFSRQKSNRSERLGVKGSDVINDSTMQDARETHLTETCHVIDNGSDAVGIPSFLGEWTPEKFQSDFANVSLIISKGQGNPETLMASQKRIFFLFQSKRDAVSKELGLSKGSMLLKKSWPAPDIIGTGKVI